MNPSQALAEVLVDELVRHGVTDVVLCPGSRSAPLAYAVQAADREGRVRLHVRVDERSAGFLALGLAKVSRRVVPVITTSGTAVANLHPAVLEAHHAGVPLLVLSCDRPAELLRTGANQTTVQPGMFGEAVRWRHEIPAPERRAGQVPVWRSAVSRACAAAMGALSGWAGPVHLDVALRDPLTPAAGGAQGCADPWPEPLDGRPGGAPWTAAVPAAGGAQRDLGESLLAAGAASRTVMVIGDLPEPELAGEAVRLARAAGWLVVSEPFGRMDREAVIPHGPLLLTCTDWLDEHLPDRVLVVGRLTLTRDVAGLLRRVARVESVTVGPDWADPASRVARVHPWAAIAAATAVLEGGPDASRVAAPDADWTRQWAEAGDRLAEAPLWSPTEVTGLSVATTVLEAAGAWSDETGRSAVVFVGSSQSARDLDWAATGSASAVTVVGSRGLAGIDGCVATAVGIALTREAPTCALMGDLTFLHDANGLLVGPAEPRPDLTIVVTNDDGGAIFATLEHGAPERAADFERVFGTPTGADLGALCAAYGVAHQRVTTLPDLRETLREKGSGIRVVEVPVDRSEVREARAQVRAAVAARLA
ncbi:2-succinyl-5-enolpyruvyl-6-hydroxy-3-cyclohexene-1-carboxylic-acid synthase [Arsenicicoccus sp. oral taxon 190]|uniref:2-succinyl-5-enolpyruvyl-6-hydroxy-3- cyclohexene-1-carboxylic-acid synthase n=1 Tax=Arsenicicoccus sp. oral taxon 190 TaxID=1658671 RepID=UPI00067A0464|nr:2-succinyl-5-enolpyruvyl-6-hydroxy-3-cyclohexene-1-carboxylic-acid synthase [Arsenicicoccus sp. oral taxon 190]AKT51219.1 hypothetical protein ADJ73_07665 [Arsenicicoccus sp. oral taxon 190]